MHAAELVVEPNFQILRRHRRSLLLRLEHPHRSAVENHFHRPTRLGSSRSLKLRIGINAPTAALCMKLSDTRKPSPTIRMRRTAKSAGNIWVRRTAQASHTTNSLACRMARMYDRSCDAIDLNTSVDVRMIAGAAVRMATNRRVAQGI